MHTVVLACLHIYLRESFVCCQVEAAGMKATAGVKVGPFVMGVVVEGRDGATCTINLNGTDTAQGAMKRWRTRRQQQRALERAGWRFIDAWQAAWQLKPEYAQQALLKVIASLGNQLADRITLVDVLDLLVVLQEYTVWETRSVSQWRSKLRQALTMSGMRP